MSFFQLVRREMQSSLPRLGAMAALGGISNAAILAAVNAGAQSAGGGSVSLSSAVLFIIALIIFINAQQYVLITTTVEIEAIIHRLRLRLMDEVRRSELVPLENIGRSEIVGVITKETAILTQAANMFAFAGQSLVLVCFVAIYVAYLSPFGFLLSGVIIGFAAVFFHAKSRQLTATKQEASEWENRLFDRLTDLLDGFKEVRLNDSRSNDLFGDIVEVSRNAANLKIHSQAETFKRLVFSQGSMYILLGAIVFVVPAFSDTLGTSIAKMTLALVFVLGTCFGLVQTIPVLAAANAASDNIERLEKKLIVAGAARKGEHEIADQPKLFHVIEMRNVLFRYVDTESVFQVGPFDFTLRSGDLVFITGGNGSGKSTFLKLLTGLCKPESGDILLDGVRVDETTHDSYRGLIAAIFTDYHLFKRLYGIPDPDSAEVDRLLAKFELHDKTRVIDGEFTSLDLSGGQRKRLALMVSLLENRPILLLDELTADQDPEFRRKFYHDLLPELLRQGLTIVVITHDDRYLNELRMPCTRLRMDEGRFVGPRGENDR
jgi:putative ATP-binding cassette transporter